MVDASPEDTLPPPDSGRARRAPPTIDLEATEVSGQTRSAGTDAPGAGAPGSASWAGAASDPGQAAPEPASRAPAAISAWVIAAVSGAVAASLVICVAWMLGWGPGGPPHAASQRCRHR
jgi:hypothetical protein